MGTTVSKLKRFRKNRKQQLIEGMGGKCQICSYSKCNSALELHHVNPLDKDPNYSQMITRNWKWEKVEKEIMKCILLCANCHREIHDNIVKLPDNYQIFDKSLITSKKPKVVKPETILKERTFKVKWDSLDWEYLTTVYKTNKEIAQILNVSDSLVSREKRKRNFIFH